MLFLRGRISRKGYIFFTLLYVVYLLPLVLFSLCFFVPYSCTIFLDFFIKHQGVYLCINFVIWVISFPATVRRLHDRDKSELWIILGMIPGIGALWSIENALSKGTTGPNQYGPDPLDTSNQIGNVPPVANTPVVNEVTNQPLSQEGDSQSTSL